MAFVSLKAMMDKTLKGSRLTEGLEAYSLLMQWKTLVGEVLAEHAKPVRVKNGILYVEVDDPVWLSQIKYMKGGILSKVDREIKEGAIKDLRFYLGGIR